MPGLYRIVEGPLDLQAAIQAVSGPDRGAIATFIVLIVVVIVLGGGWYGRGRWY